MIASLSGRVKIREAGRLVLDTGGVGYEVFIPLATYYRIPALGAQVDLEIRQVVREESITLYGFATPSEKQAFDLLLGVQHVGPKLALAILSVLSPEDLVDAITQGDVDRIDAVPGVGPKVAERCVRELRDKISALNLAVAERPRTAGNGHGGASPLLDDALSALVNLGYKPVEAKRAVDSIGTEGASEGLEALIRKSLAVLLGEK
ncbi:MAG TPA: Holliday junction branch migration protein RuvA [Candidatus Binataceae bacterium]|nr:Holliday junction branch migration protein RuvA [Candidatus Binataceae bacterium]